LIYACLSKYMQHIILLHTLWGDQSQDSKCRSCKELVELLFQFRLTLTLEPSSKVESLFLCDESLIVVLNIIKFSVGEDEIVNV
jgi:hypothetical protein